MPTEHPTPDKFTDKQRELAYACLGEKLDALGGVLMLSRNEDPLEFDDTLLRQAYRTGRGHIDDTCPNLGKWFYRVQLPVAHKASLRSAYFVIPEAPKPVPPKEDAPSE